MRKNTPDAQHIGEVISLPSKRQLNRVNKAVEIFDKSAIEVGALGFLSRLFAQVGLPHTKPDASLKVWSRRNGNLRGSTTNGTESNVRRPN